MTTDVISIFGILHPELNKPVKIKDHVCPLRLSEGMSFHRLWAYLTSEALSLPPGKPSRALLGQRVVVGVFLWCVEQHLSAGDTQRTSYFCLTSHDYVQQPGLNKP